MALPYNKIAINTLNAEWIPKLAADAAAFSRGMQMNFNQYKKTRFAPTPSGFLHLGNVMSFAVTAALARKTGAKISLRIDDLDRDRVNKQYMRDIFDTLNFLELPWDEGPQTAREFEQSYSQLYRMNMYNDGLARLADNGMVYSCTCSRKQLLTGEQCFCMEKQIPLLAENSCWRLITTANRELTVKRYDGQQISAFLPAGMQNFVVKKKDGFPAYQLTSVIDDLFYGIDLVIRGDDLWPSTLAQHELASALGKSRFNDIAFFHHPLLLESSGHKMSKSAGTTSIKYLRENGKSKNDVFSLIGSMFGSDENINNWQQLARIVSMI